MSDCTTCHHETNLHRKVLNRDGLLLGIFCMNKHNGFLCKCRRIKITGKYFSALNWNSTINWDRELFSCPGYGMHYQINDEGWKKIDA
jgi:hypothetical protein